MSIYILAKRDSWSKIEETEGPAGRTYYMCEKDNMIDREREASMIGNLQETALQISRDLQRPGGLLMSSYFTSL